MSWKKKVLIFYVVSTVIGFIAMTLGEIAWKSRVEEIRNSDYIISGKIVDINDKGRGIHLRLSDNSKIYTNAFVEFLDSLKVNDSIYKPTRSNCFYYYKFDSLNNNYRYLDSSECTTLSFE